MTDHVFPPTGKGRVFETYAICLREFAGLRDARHRLDPFKLAQYANLLVADFELVKPLLTEETLGQLVGAGKDSWSGGACSQPLPDGRKLIILNPTHGKNRQNATLMEEICHVFLGHKPSRLAFRENGTDSNLKARDYNAEIEEQAYSVGAAALVPYESLREFVIRGRTSRQIARHFDVSRQLVEYRIKVSKLWKDYLSVQGDGRPARRKSVRL
ncbi:MAG: ImmA/IrrE family metallo-endopeptidase [Acidobacteria bacterium]|nr:MAG: ImmA/IrrE family metallo-endopeptidase [Acidobacteriota bacterium]REK02139.1 MAG: ImmA/IrrE family metallo-endopeptidase [Acidobacteriota bacterium]REK14059.1 MAG: ImmA/IrrE family metallo-endopeptidase [Acidobacteriota bacterium]REK42054.1 MAG: ImmA/IrrE family metallo-endopeptidase [Acidobacteriota bacterium]